MGYTNVGSFSFFFFGFGVSFGDTVDSFTLSKGVAAPAGSYAFCSESAPYINVFGGGCATPSHSFLAVWSDAALTFPTFSL